VLSYSVFTSAFLNSLSLSLSLSQLPSFHSYLRWSDGLEDIFSKRSFLISVVTVCLCTRCHVNVFTIVTQITMHSLHLLKQKHDYRAIVSQQTPLLCFSGCVLPAFRRMSQYILIQCLKKEELCLYCKEVTFHNKMTSGTVGSKNRKSLPEDTRNILISRF
jgi:hypothetical protein